MGLPVAELKRRMPYKEFIAWLGWIQVYNYRSQQSQKDNRG
jgi:hypothetical protein